MTDGGDDGGFDAPFIDDMGSEFTIVLFQAKYTFNLNKDSGFPENALEKAVEAIRCIFDPEINRQLNEKSVAVVDTIHSLLYAGRIPRLHSSVLITECIGTAEEKTLLTGPLAGILRSILNIITVRI